MADAKISALTNLTAADAINDMIPIVDVSDTPPASGNTKRISINNILSSSPTASGALTVTGLVTAGSATITGAATVGTTLGVTGVSTFAAGTAALPALTTTGDANTGIYYPAADTFAVTTGGTERVRVDTSGNLVLGQSSSALQGGGTGITIFGATASEIKFLNSTTGSNATDGTALVTGSNNFSINNREAGTVSIGTSNTNRLVIEAAGDVTVSTGNVVMATSGKGIDFSATASGSGTMTSELLDDYEEGTWVGTIGGTTTNPTTPVTSTGRYTKIGRQVSVEIGFYGDTTGASGRITVSGLPFTSNASLSRPGVIIMTDIGTFTGSPVAYLAGGVTSVDLYASNSNASSSNVTHNAGAGRSLYMQLTYTV